MFSELQMGNMLFALANNYGVASNTTAKFKALLDGLKVVVNLDLHHSMCTQLSRICLFSVTHAPDNYKNKFWYRLWILCELRSVCIY